MTRFKPIYGILLVILAVGGFWAVNLVIEALQGRGDFQRVSPSPQGEVRIDVGDLKTGEARFYHFLNPSNQEVEFFIARDQSGTFQVAFNAGDSHYKVKRGFSVQDGWVIDNKCGTTSRLTEVNAGGSGCRPVPLAHRVQGDQVVLTERDILAGWRYFR